MIVPVIFKDTYKCKKKKKQEKSFPFLSLDFSVTQYGI